MKKLLTMAIAAAMLIGCAEDGEDGAQGPVGPSGAQGPGATHENVVVTFDDDSPAYFHFPETDVHPYSTAVLVYVKDNSFDEWHLLSYRDVFGQDDPVTYSSSYEEDMVIIESFGDNGFYYDWGSSYEVLIFNIVYIPFSAMQGDIDLNNFEAVEAAYLKN